MTDQDYEDIKAFEEWENGYALAYEPNYSPETLQDCRAAFLAGLKAARAQPAQPCKTCESLARTVMLDQAGHDDYYKRMFEAAVSSLAKIDRLLGINDDGCGGSEETIEAVRELAEAQATTAQEPTVDDSIAQLVDALKRSKGWLGGYADAVIRDAIDRKHLEETTAQEPVAWIRGSGLEMLKLENGGAATVFASSGMSNYSTPLYTHTAAPAKPLSEEQIKALMPKADGTAEANKVWLKVGDVPYCEFDEVDAWSEPLVMQLARAIEAAHGIKEQA